MYVYLIQFTEFIRRVFDKTCNSFPNLEGEGWYAFTIPPHPESLRGYEHFWNCIIPCKPANFKFQSIVKSKTVNSE